MNEQELKKILSKMDEPPARKTDEWSRIQACTTGVEKQTAHVIDVKKWLWFSGAALAMSMVAMLFLNQPWYEKKDASGELISSTQLSDQELYAFVEDTYAYFDSGESTVSEDSFMVY